jgi:hypothetical protein
MTRPHLLLVPGFTELEWTIKPKLPEWADVASYDPPGVGEEPAMPQQEEAVVAGKPVMRETIAQRGLEELERRGWERCFVLSDGDGNGAAALLARARPDAIEGMAMGHAVLAYEMEGERPTMNKELWLAMRQLLRQDYGSFIRHGIVQLTQGAYGDELAQKMIERFPKELVERGWEMARSEPVAIGEILREIGCPLLLAKHEGCLGRTDEGFEDIVATFPDAQTVICPETCTSSPAYADAVRRFAESIAAPRPSGL